MGEASSAKRNLMSPKGGMGGWCVAKQHTKWQPHYRDPVSSTEDFSCSF